MRWDIFETDNQTQWRESQPNPDYQKTIVLDSSLIAYPASKGAKYAIHFHCTFGIRSTSPFSIIHYCRYIDVKVSLPKNRFNCKLDYSDIYEMHEYGDEGKLVVGHLRESCRTNMNNLKPELASLNVILGIKFCHPVEPETLIKTRVPLYIHSGTGPLSNSSKNKVPDAGKLPSTFTNSL